MTPCQLTAPAERALEDLFFEVKERHGLLVAERVYDNLLRMFDLLARMPEVGRYRSALWPPPYRFWVTAPAFIGYRAAALRIGPSAYWQLPAGSALRGGVRSPLGCAPFDPSVTNAACRSFPGRGLDRPAPGDQSCRQ